MVTKNELKDVVKLGLNVETIEECIKHIEGKEKKRDSHLKLGEDYDQVKAVREATEESSEKRINLRKGKAMHTRVEIN